MNRYIDLIQQTFDFPTKEFTVENNQLYFNGVNLMEIIETYGTPLKLTYLPKISENIQHAKTYFGKAMQTHNYQGKYTYCYCTKSSHFSFVLDEALKNDIHIETSSTFDIPLVRSLYAKGKIRKDTYIICNGFKREKYKQYVSELLNDGFVNCVPILDNLTEIDYYLEHVKVPFQVGIRIASDEEPKFGFYTSRLGVRYNDIISLYEEKIKNNPQVSLKMLHFFINSGIKDTAYYWSELTRFIQKYVELKRVAPSLDSMDIGGGWPIKTNVFFDYDYQYMADQIVKNIKWMCAKNNTTEPSWGLNQKYIMLAVNNWEEEYHNISLGGLTCDSMDYYNSEAHQFNIYLPKLVEKKQQYIGFFHTGAYQESLGGYGGIQHCLIPAPKHVLIDRDENGQVKHWLFASDQKEENMLKILGY